MKPPLILEPWLKEWHWQDLADFHLDLRYCRHRFIRNVNERLAAGGMAEVEHLDQLAQVDELLQAACDNLERAKTVLFDVCYESTASTAHDEKIDD
jgi:hypothetical protein